MAPFCRQPAAVLRDMQHIRAILDAGDKGQSPMFLR